jgi:hypothetical protein
MHERVTAALKAPFDRAALKLEMCNRMRIVRDRLAGRMCNLPGDDWLAQRLEGLNGSTLKVMVESDPWFTAEVGGEEVTIDE